jgi:hypothetical protein
MKSSQGAAGSPPVEAGHHVTDHAKAFFHQVTDAFRHPEEGAPQHEPTIVEIVDHVTAMHRGESYDVALDPHITRIKNLEKLLPICVEQFGHTVDTREHPEGDKVILTITVTGEQSHR